MLAGRGQAEEVHTWSKVGLSQAVNGAVDNAKITDGLYIMLFELQK